MSAAPVPIEIDQGEDFTAQIVWTDNYDEPQNLVDPARMEIKAPNGTIMYTLETNPSIPEGEIADITLSPTTGLIQLHIPHTATSAFVPGNYIYDLFVTVSDSNVYAGNQTHRLLVGPVIVNKRITVMT